VTHAGNEIPPEGDLPSVPEDADICRRRRKWGPLTSVESLLVRDSQGRHHVDSKGAIASAAPAAGALRNGLFIIPTRPPRPTRASRSRARNPLKRSPHR
jgi:hypothetical protein